MYYFLRNHISIHISRLSFRYSALEGPCPRFFSFFHFQAFRYISPLKNTPVVSGLPVCRSPRVLHSAVSRVRGLFNIRALSTSYGLSCAMTLGVVTGNMPKEEAFGRRSIPSSGWSQVRFGSGSRPKRPTNIFLENGTKEKGWGRREKERENPLVLR